MGLGLNVRRGVEAQLFPLRQADGGEMALAAAMDGLLDAIGQHYRTLQQLALEDAARAIDNKKPQGLRRAVVCVA
ncbi:hypothetical protein [Chromobacterium subtsugae]|uniref:hypothetical protein n=1 Tax=Chromobacterium subtsugae TaxID=251747 RepID=UPI000641753F|nr:hypothetical protein [Chromobacterium subtsugae]